MFMGQANHQCYSQMQPMRVLNFVVPVSRLAGDFRQDNGVWYEYTDSIPSTYKQNLNSESGGVGQRNASARYAVPDWTNNYESFIEQVGGGVIVLAI